MQRGTVSPQPKSHQVARPPKQSQRRTYTELLPHSTRPRAGTNTSVDAQVDQRFEDRASTSCRRHSACCCVRNPGNWQNVGLGVFAKAKDLKGNALSTKVHSEYVILERKVLICLVAQYFAAYIARRSRKLHTRMTSNSLTTLRLLPCLDPCDDVLRPP